MSSYEDGQSGLRRRGALAALTGLAGLAALSGCGFRPVYAPGGGGAALDGQVAVRVSGGTIGFLLGQELQNRLGPAESARFRLTYSLAISSERVAVTAAQTTNRFNLVGRANYSLTDSASGKVIATGMADAFSGFSATGTTVATRTAQRDAFRRLTSQLADKIVADLIAAPGVFQ